jgi:hypothetical protein
VDVDEQRFCLIVDGETVEVNATSEVSNVDIEVIRKG